MNDTEVTTDIDKRFWRMFSRVLGRPVPPGRHERAQLPEWDSLRHVELVFEIEEQFGITVPQEAIAGLFSDTDTLLAFVRRHAAEG